MNKKHRTAALATLVLVLAACTQHPTPPALAPAGSGLPPILKTSTPSN